MKVFEIQPPQNPPNIDQNGNSDASIQACIEANLDALFGIRLLATECTFGPEHECIRTLGLDENAEPVVIEYKGAFDGDALCRGLYRRDLVQAQPAVFKRLVLEKFGEDVASKIDGSTPRLLCLSTEFSPVDRHAARKYIQTIELIRYAWEGPHQLLLERV